MDEWMGGQTGIDRWMDGVSGWINGKRRKSDYQKHISGRIGTTV